MPRVLITGAAGFIGMHTTIKFLSEGWEVFGLDNMNDYYSVDLKRKRIKEILHFSKQSKIYFRFFEEDLNSSVWSSFSDYRIDAVIHLAAQAGVRYSLENPGAYLQSNIHGFQKVIEFVEKHKIERFIYASSSSVYGKSSKQPFSELEACNKPESYYAATKISNELMAYSYFKTKGIHSVGLRFFTVYGPWGRPDMAPYIFAEAAFHERIIKVFNHGNQKRDFTYIDDIVEGIFLSVKRFDRIKGAEIFNIGYGSPTGLNEFINEIENATNRTLSKRYVDAQLGDVEVTFADTNKFQEYFEFKPKVELKKGVNKFIYWYMNFKNLS